MPTRRPGESFAAYLARVAAWRSGGGASAPGGIVGGGHPIPIPGAGGFSTLGGDVEPGEGEPDEEGGGGGAAGGGGPTSTATRRSITEDETINRTSTRNVNRQVRRYVDVPTPEEFLDDFRTGMSTYLKGLGGGISRNAGMWLMENMDMFLNDYLGDLGTRAARGEQVFKVVGLGGEVTPLGTRPGQVIGTQGTGTTVQTTQGTQTIGTQGTAQKPGGQVESVGGAQTTQTTQGTQTVNETENENINETENIYARPNLTTVHAISPMDFMKSNWTPASLNIRYEGFKGARQARARTATGAVSTRRVT